MKKYINVNNVESIEYRYFGIPINGKESIHIGTVIENHCSLVFEDFDEEHYSYDTVIEYLSGEESEISSGINIAMSNNRIYSIGNLHINTTMFCSIRVDVKLNMYSSDDRPLPPAY